MYTSPTTSQMIWILLLSIVDMCLAHDINKTYSWNICKTVSTFTPNFCSYEAARQYCENYCDTFGRIDTLECGIRKPLSSIKRNHPRFRRVVGGVTSQKGEWPWQVSLRLNGTQWCAGAILSETFILTAAHCFDKDITSLNPQDWQIYAGDHELYGTNDTKEQKIEVKKIIRHPDYQLSLHQHKKGVWVTADHDIAILELKERVNLVDENKGTLCLPDKVHPFVAGSKCHVVGWGHTSYNGTQPNYLMHAKVVIVPTDICNRPNVYNNTVHGKYLICAGYAKGGIDACNYDSGGSMVCRRNGRWYSTGIVSSGFECARSDAYGLYSRVQTDKQWIVESLLSKNSKKRVVIT